MKRTDMPEPWPPDFLLFGEKICDTCGRVLPRCATHFGLDASRGDGLSNNCRDCRNAHERNHPRPARGKAARLRRQCKEGIMEGQARG